MMRPLDRLGAQATKAPLSTAIVLECGSKPLLIEVRPQAVAEMQLRKCAFPEQKIAEAPLVAGANQQVDLAGGVGAMIDFMQQAVKVLGAKIRAAIGPPRGLHDAVLRRVVDRDAQEHS